MANIVREKAKASVKKWRKITFRSLLGIKNPTKVDNDIYD